MEPFFVGAKRSHVDPAGGDLLLRLFEHLVGFVRFERANWATKLAACQQVDRRDGKQQERRYVPALQIGVCAIQQARARTTTTPLGAAA